MSDNSLYSILVVEDDAPTRQLLKVLLGTAFRVDCAGDGAEALVLLEHRDYAAVVLDLKMPKVDGFEVIRRITASSPDLLDRVIVLTAIPASSSSMLGFDPPIWRVMRKPLEIPELLRTVRDCIARAPLSREA